MIGGGKADFLASRNNGSEGARSMADLLSSKLEHDEQEERVIQELQLQLNEVRDRLGQAKFKYE